MTPRECPRSSQPPALTTRGPRGRCHSKPQTEVAFICRRIRVHLRECGCPVSAGPPRHPPYSPPPHHPPSSSSPMASHLYHPPHTHTAPHNPHPHHTPTIPPTPYPTLHHHHTPVPTTSTPTPSAPSKDPVQLPPVGHTQPHQGSLDTLLPSEDRVSHRVPRGCRKEGRQGAPDRVGAGEWCRRPTVPCLNPLSLLEGGTPCIGHQPLTQRDMGWPGPGLCGGCGDLSPPGPTQRLTGSSPPMALASPGFWPQAERVLPQLDVAYWALGVPNTCLGR